MCFCSKRGSKADPGNSSRAIHVASALSNSGHPHSGHAVKLVFDVSQDKHLDSTPTPASLVFFVCWFFFIFPLD